MSGHDKEMDSTVVLCFLLVFTGCWRRRVVTYHKECHVRDEKRDATASQVNAQQNRLTKV